MTIVIIVINYLGPRPVGEEVALGEEVVGRHLEVVFIVCLFYMLLLCVVFMLFKNVIVGRYC